MYPINEFYTKSQKNTNLKNQMKDQDDILNIRINEMHLPNVLLDKAFQNYLNFAESYFYLGLLKAECVKEKDNRSTKSTKKTFYFCESF